MRNGRSMTLSVAFYPKVDTGIFRFKGHERSIVPERLSIQEVFSGWTEEHSGWYESPIRKLFEMQLVGLKSEWNFKELHSRSASEPAEKAAMHDIRISVAFILVHVQKWTVFPLFVRHCLLKILPDLTKVTEAKSCTRNDTTSGALIGLFHGSERFISLMVIILEIMTQSHFYKSYLLQL